MALIDRPDISLKNIKRMNLEDDPSKRPKKGVCVYYFDDDGNELGYSTPITPPGKINNSTAGREWSDELKSKLI